METGKAFDLNAYFYDEDQVWEPSFDRRIFDVQILVPDFHKHCSNGPGRPSTLLAEIRYS